MPKSINLVDRIFYVYALFRPHGIVCYIGKGVGDRIDRHERFARRDANSNKHLLNIIRNAGGAIPKIVIRDGLLEAEAFELESIFIRAIGLERDGGPLINLTYGGEGPSGLVFSDDTLRIMSEKSLVAWSDPEKREEQRRHQKAIWSTEERKKRGVADARESWKDPERRARHRESLENYWSDPAARERHGEILRRAFDNPEHSRAKSEISRKAWEELRTSPEKLGEFISKRGRAVSDYWSTEEGRSVMMDAIKAGWENEDRRAAASARAKAWWSDPTKRAKMKRMKWWHTPEGVNYRSDMPRNPNDEPGVMKKR